MMKKIYYACTITAVSAFVILCLTVICNNIHCMNAHYTPDYAMQSLESLAAKTFPEEEDYRTLLYQTGLGRPAVDMIFAGESTPQMRLAVLQKYQDAFFAPVSWNGVTELYSPNSFHRQELSDGSLPDVPMVPLQDGDILLTTASATLGFPNGHAGIVVDAANGLCLEAVSINADSALCSVTHWTDYANFMVYRLKDSKPEISHIVAENAADTLLEKPYSLTVGVFGKKYEPCAKLTATHCAHLVWEAYADYGYDLDSNDGLLVWVEDIARSEHLELIQIYGINPKTR